MSTCNTLVHGIIITFCGSNHDQCDRNVELQKVVAPLLELEHQNLIKFHGSYAEDEANAIIIMQFVSGGMYPLQLQCLNLSSNKLLCNIQFDIESP